MIGCTVCRHQFVSGPQAGARMSASIGAHKSKNLILQVTYLTFVTI